MTEHEELLKLIECAGLDITAYRAMSLKDLRDAIGDWQSAAPEEYAAAEALLNQCHDEQTLGYFNRYIAGDQLPGLAAGLNQGDVQMIITRQGPGSYELTDGRRTVTIVRNDELAGSDKWVAYANWDKYFLTDPVATLRDAKRYAAEMLAD